MHSNLLDESKTPTLHKAEACSVQYTECTVKQQHMPILHYCKPLKLFTWSQLTNVTWLF